MQKYQSDFEYFTTQIKHFYGGLMAFFWIVTVNLRENYWHGGE